MTAHRTRDVSRCKRGSSADHLSRSPERSTGRRTSCTFAKGSDSAPGFTHLGLSVILQPEDGFHVVVHAKGLQILRLLAKSHEIDGQLEFCLLYTSPSP